jgi:two-component system LytT family response regulator
MRLLIAEDEAQTRSNLAQFRQQQPDLRTRDPLQNERLVLQDAPRHLTGEKGHRLYFIPVESIGRITADGNYVQIHAEGEQYISRNTLKGLESMLAPMGFLRITRACMINLRQVAFAEKLPGGVFEFALRCGDRATSTSSFRKAILSEIYKHQRDRGDERQLSGR